VSFAIIANKLESYPGKYDSREEFEKLCRMALNPSQGTEMLYKRSLYDSNVELLGESKYFGCANQACPERKQLLSLAAEVKTWEDLSSSDRELANNYGYNMKLCGG
jgi:hypothetical protein